MTDTTHSAAPPASVLPPPERDDWVPADERVAGFDRRTIWPGAVLLVVWALWAHVMPWIDGQIEVDNPVSVDDVVNLGAGEVTFAPAAGWNLESGTLLLAGAEDAAQVPATAVLSSDTVSYTASSGNWEGTAEELADRAIDLDETFDQLVAADERGREVIENVDGVAGQVVYVAGTDDAVLIATFVFERDDGTSPDIGVQIQAQGTPTALEEQVEDIASMIESTTYASEGQEATP